MSVTFVRIKLRWSTVELCTQIMSKELFTKFNVPILFTCPVGKGEQYYIHQGRVIPRRVKFPPAKQEHIMWMIYNYPNSRILLATGSSTVTDWAPPSKLTLKQYFLLLLCHMFQILLNLFVYFYSYGNLFCFVFLCLFSTLFLFLFILFCVTYVVWNY